MSVQQHRLTICTPLFDPHGNALRFFQGTARSVLNQTLTDFEWLISVQDIDTSYEKIIDLLRADPRVKIAYNASAVGLGEHVTQMLSGVRTNCVHILCQDDRYGSPRSAESILTILEATPVLFIRPGLSSKVSCRDGEMTLGKIRWESNAQSFRERTGVNWLGGLSSIAWRTDATTDPIVLRLNLFADLELRRRLRDSGVTAAICSDRGMVLEARWDGQSQFRLGGERGQEANAWVKELMNSRNGAIAHSALAALLGDPVLSRAWQEQALTLGAGSVRAGVVTHISMTLGLAVRGARSVSRRLRRTHGVTPEIN